jgi:hypothetical protein
MLTADYPESYSFMPLIEFSGDGYGILWELDQSLIFMRLDSEGNHAGEDLVLDPDFTRGGHFSLVHASAEYAAVWVESSAGETIAFARISDWGDIIDGPVDFTNGSLDECPSVACTGTGYGVVYERAAPEARDNNLYLALLSMDGERIIPEDVRITDDSQYPYYPKIIHNGSEYAVAWLDISDDSAVYLNRLHEDGTMEGDSFMIADTLIHSNRFPIVAAGPEYAAVWEHGDNLMFCRFGCMDRVDP